MINLKKGCKINYVKLSGCSAVGSALGSGPRGRGFESRHSDQKIADMAEWQTRMIQVHMRNRAGSSPVIRTKKEWAISHSFFISREARAMS